MASGKACANCCIVKPYDYNAAASLLNCSSNIIPPYQAGNACMWASSARKNIMANLSWDTHPEKDMHSSKVCANSCIVKPYDYNAASLLNCSSNIIPPYQAGNACMWASSARKNILANLSWDTNPEEDMASGKACTNSCIVKPYDYNAASLLNCSSNIIPPYQAGNACMWASSARKNILANLSWDTNPEEDMASGKACANSCIVKPYDYNAASLLNCSSNIIPPYQAGNACMWASSARKNILANLSWDTNPEEDMASGKACTNSCIVKPYDYNAASLLNCSSNIIPPYQAGNACMWASSARKNILANLSWDTNPEEDMASGKACANSCIVKPYDYNAASLLNCSSNIIPPYQAGNACMWASSARKNILANLSWDTNPEEDMASGKACANCCIVKPYDYNAASLLNCSSNIIPPYQAGNACMWASSARKNILANLSWDTHPEKDMHSSKVCANSCIVKPYDYNAASLLNCSSNIIPPIPGNACMWASSARKNLLANLSWDTDPEKDMHSSKACFVCCSLLLSYRNMLYLKIFLSDSSLCAWSFHPLVLLWVDPNSFSWWSSRILLYLATISGQHRQMILNLFNNQPGWMTPWQPSSYTFKLRWFWISK